MGKTPLARSLRESATTEVLELNCSSGEEPDLRDFIWSKHKLILFDESHPQMVTKQRLLFQADIQLIQLGTSATNCHNYTVCCHGIHMVLCTNCWHEEARLLIPEDRDWVFANSIELCIDSPCCLS